MQIQTDLSQMYMHFWHCFFLVTEAIRMFSGGGQDQAHFLVFVFLFSIKEC